MRKRRCHTRLKRLGGLAVLPRADAVWRDQAVLNATYVELDAVSGDLSHGRAWSGFERALDDRR